MQGATGQVVARGLGMRLGSMAAALAAFFMGAASAEDGTFYMGAVATHEVSDANEFVFDDQPGFHLIAGAEVARHWRAQASVSRRRSDVVGIPPIETEGRYDSWAYMLTGLYHPLGVDARFSPYLGAGIGLHLAELRAFATEEQVAVRPETLDLGYPEQEFREIAGQAQLGTTVRLTDHLSLNLVGTYYHSGTYTYEATFPNNPRVEANFRTYALGGGLLVRF